jgi:hypothetical protein
MPEELAIVKGAVRRQTVENDRANKVNIKNHSQVPSTGNR